MMVLTVSFFLVFVSVPLRSQTGPASPAAKIEDLLKTNSYEVSVSNGSLSGPGLDFLMKATGRTQFFAIAEPHNSKEVPEITSLLFKSLHGQHGFNYLALEQDPVMARMVSAPGVVGNRDAVNSLARRYPNGFTFITDQELEMISAIGSVSNGKADRIWGLDQMFGAIHVLDRLSKFAPSKQVGDRTLRLVEVLKRNEAEQTKQMKRYTMADVGNIDEFNELLHQYHPQVGSEAEFLIAQMLISARIYKNNIAAESGQLTGYDSNLEREENMKALFMLDYRRAQAAGDPLPKVVLKLGHYHLVRGRSWSDVLSLGNFISEFAKSNEMDSFHLAIYNNNASGDYGVLAATPEYKPLGDAASKDKWTVVDLRPLRALAHAGKVTGLSSELRRVIFGFDAAFLVGGASPGTYKVLGFQ
jgi:hypothetical protein